MTALERVGSRFVVVVCYLVVVASIFDSCVAEAQQITTSEIESRLSRHLPKADKALAPSLAEVISTEAAATGLEASLILSVIYVESYFRIWAVSPKDCRGLMQLLPATFRWWVDTFGYEGMNPRIHDPVVNIRIGSRYLAHLMTIFDGDVRLSLMAYNAGPHNIQKWLRRGQIPADVRDYPVLVERARRRLDFSSLGIASSR